MQQQQDGSTHRRNISQKRVTPEDVEKAKKENAKREEQLRESLKGVEKWV